MPKAIYSRVRFMVQNTLGWRDQVRVIQERGCLCWGEATQEWCPYISRKVMEYAMVISNFHRRQMYSSSRRIDGDSYPFFSFHSSFYSLPFPSVSLEFYLHKLFSPIFVRGHPFELWLHQHAPLSSTRNTNWLPFFQTQINRPKDRRVLIRNLFVCPSLNTYFSLLVKGAQKNGQASWLAICGGTCPSLYCPRGTNSVKH